MTLLKVLVTTIVVCGVGLVGFARESREQPQLGRALALGVIAACTILYMRVGILSSARLRASRRFVFLGLFIFAAVATPGGDLVSPIVLFTTMYILFELTVVAIRRSGR